MSKGEERQVDVGEGNVPTSYVKVGVNYKGDTQPEIKLIITNDEIIGEDKIDRAIEIINGAIERIQ